MLADGMSFLIRVPSIIASAIFIMSGIMNGNTHIDRTDNNEIVPPSCTYTCINHIVPKA